MRAVGRDAGDDLVPFGDLVLDDVVEVREGGAEGAEYSLTASRTVVVTGTGGGVWST